MKSEFSTAPGAGIATDALIVLTFEGAPAKLGAQCDAAIAQLQDSGESPGKAMDLALLHAPAGLAAKRLIVAGCGKAENFRAFDLRRVAGAALRFAKSKAARHVTLLLEGAQRGPAMVEAATGGAILAGFEPDQHKTEPAKKEKRVETFVVAAPGAGAEAEGAFHRAVILAESQNFTRALVNEPANLLPPMELAARARVMAGEEGIECDVLDADRMRQLGMGSLLGVAQGSEHPPALIVVRYRPAAASAKSVHLGLVGKGVTFDTGGISIKPADGMEKMRYDMAGGATVLGAIRALARLRPAIPVTALVPAVENMLSGRAQRPGDIVTTLKGTTVEVLNTDAEGRLILNDALTYAQRIGCTHLVDIATLTGSIAVALGPVRAGAFTNNQEFLDQLMKAAEAQGERLWQMPMDDDYKEQLKSAFADVANIGTRYGGSITAAQFLKDFADPAPWIHLDIAGTAWLDDAKAWMAKGPSGVCMRSLVELAMRM